MSLGFLSAGELYSLSCAFIWAIAVILFRVDALELLEGNQPRQAFIQLRLGLHPASGIEAGQQRWQFTQEGHDGG